MFQLFLLAMIRFRVVVFVLAAACLAAYATYFVNATQFLLKLRRARLDSAEPRGHPA